MGLFSPVKSFLSVVLKDNICKFYYRKLSGKKVVDEKVEKMFGLPNYLYTIKESLKYKTKN